MKQSPVDEGSLQPYLFLPRKRYTRNLIFKNNPFELMAVYGKWARLGTFTICRPELLDDDIGGVIHNYRWRLSLAEGDPQYDDLEKRLAEGPVIAVPTITLDGEPDGVTPASDGSADARKFSGKHTHRIIKGGASGNCNGNDQEGAENDLPEFCRNAPALYTALAAYE